MALIIEDKDLALVNMNEHELRVEIATILYEKNRISLGKASDFAGMNKILFMKELAKREIAVNYDEEELMRDIETLGL
jgi:predicted HTH domain antitoxin